MAYCKGMALSDRSKLRAITQCPALADDKMRYDGCPKPRESNEPIMSARDATGAALLRAR